MSNPSLCQVVSDLTTRQRDLIGALTSIAEMCLEGPNEACPRILAALREAQVATLAGDLDRMAQVVGPICGGG